MPGLTKPLGFLEKTYPTRHPHTLHQTCPQYAGMANSHRPSYSTNVAYPLDNQQRYLGPALPNAGQVAG